MKRYIITGTQAVEKTSVIRALELIGASAVTNKLEDSLKFEQIHREAYAKFGYECVVIPARPIDERVAIILRGINEKMLNNE